MRHGSSVPVLDKTKGRTFGDIASEEASTSHGGVLLDDQYTSYVKSLPSHCGVTDPALQDRRLRKYYDGLPNLRFIFIIADYDGFLTTSQKGHI